MRKKNIKKIVLVALILTVITSLLMVNAFAIVVTEHTSCADHYFEELDGDAIPENVIGSCGYVASTMLLAYYDSYWNDNFVSDVYEQDVAYDSVSKEFGSSTFMTENGILEAWYQQYHSEDSTLSEDEYKEQVYPGFVNTNHAWSFLHLDLIKIGISKGYHIGFSTENYEVSITETANILDAYFDDIFGEYAYYNPLNLDLPWQEDPPIKIRVLKSDYNTPQSDVLNKMYELLNVGIPVMFRGEDASGNGHRMIAYSAVTRDNAVDYNVHMGWEGESREPLSNIVYNSDMSILWLEIDESQIPHVHCDNYVEGNNRYCSCQVYGDLHKEHEHEKGSIISYDETKHIYDCKWGCDDPDDIVEELHTLIDYGVDATGNHIYKCHCGYEEERPHIFRYTPISDSINARSYHYAICDCGYRELDEHSFVVSANPRYSRCQHCGYTRDEWGSGGGNVIMGKKEDEETE